MKDFIHNEFMKMCVVAYLMGLKTYKLKSLTIAIYSIQEYLVEVI